MHLGQMTSSWGENGHSSQGSPAGCSFPGHPQSSVPTIDQNNCPYAGCHWLPDRYARPTPKRTAKRFSIDQNLMVALSRQESASNPRAVSPVGALGLMQLMPTTAAGLMGIEAWNLIRPQQHPQAVHQRLSGLLILFKKMLKNFGGKVEYAFGRIQCRAWGSQPLEKARRGARGGLCRGDCLRRDPELREKFSPGSEKNTSFSNGLGTR